MGETAVSLDLYQPEAFFLQQGIYIVDGSNTDYTIDPGYSSIKINGTEEQLKSGDMIVSFSDETYLFNMDFMLASGQELKGIYTGQLNTYGPVVNFDLTGCKYAEVNEPAPNGFYYKFNDENWKLEMRIDLFADGSAPAPGVYTFSDTNENGTASSYVNLYSPYNEVTKFTEGTVTISGEGDDTVMEIDGMLEIGMTMKAVYKGALPARPVKVEKEEVVFESVTVDSYGKINETLTFSVDDKVLSLDLFQPEAFYLQPGVYTLAEGEGEFTINPQYSYLVTGGENHKLSSATAEVALNGEVYTITGNVVFEGGEWDFTYEGTLNIFGPVINLELTGCKYVEVNDPASNGFYYNFNDENWTIEMRIDLFADGSAPAPGVYTFSDTNENGTAASYVNLYSPYNVTGDKFTEGTVTISGEGDDTVVEIDGKLEMGMLFKAIYKGALPARTAK